VPGISGGVRLGLAGGPMLVAILLSRLGNLGSLVWYMPVPATNLLRDFGLAVFLACVGLESGEDFIQTVVSTSGLKFVLFGAIITFLPIFAVGVFLRAVMKMNFLELCGVICGAMTNSSTLAFANDFTRSNAPAVGYASIYPLGTLVPIVGAQLLVGALT
jgi:putative transport protein